ncbi:unnamed protein product [Prunus armeniaca]
MMNKLPWQWVCSIYQGKAVTVVHKSTVARTWTDIGILGGSPLLSRAWSDNVIQSKLSTPGTTSANLYLRSSKGFYKKPKLEVFQE